MLVHVELRGRSSENMNEMIRLVNNGEFGDTEKSQVAATCLHHEPVYLKLRPVSLC